MNYRIPLFLCTLGLVFTAYSCSNDMITNDYIDDTAEDYQPVDTIETDKTNPETQIVNKPDEQPPEEQPPIDNPPVDNPPVDDPPVDNPPVDDPPVDNPPVDDPPVDNPPIEQPPEDPTDISIQITDVLDVIDGGSSISIKGKKVLVAGNSQIYYGLLVITGNRGKTDIGYFHQAAKYDGNALTVIDYTHGGKNLDWIYSNHLKGIDASTRNSIDYVLLSEAGENNKNIDKTVKKIMDLFPNAQGVFMPHEYHYHKNHSGLLNKLKTLQDMGILIANPGELAYNIYKGKEKVEGSSYTYSRTTFVKNNSGCKNGSGLWGGGNDGDSHHPNPLHGYLETLLAYSAITGKSAVGMEYKYTDDKSIHKYFDLDAFVKAHYNCGKNTNFHKILRDKEEVTRLQNLVDKYNTKWNGKAPVSSCNHEATVESITQTYFNGSANTNGVALATCSKCGESITVDIKTTETRENIMLIPAATVIDAGYQSQKEYMLAGLGNVFYQTEKGWGRMGYSSIQGMASMCDGVRIAAHKQDGSQLYWKIADTSKKYDANGTATSDGKYMSLIGYRLNEPKEVSGFALFADALDGSLTGFDLLGGHKNEDGTYSWNVLWSGNNIKYIPYGKVTHFVHSDFEKMQVDAIQIGITEAKSNIIYASELEVYGH